MPNRLINTYQKICIFGAYQTCYIILEHKKWKDEKESKMFYDFLCLKNKGMIA